ncbi:MAG: hypothetical protein ABFC31_09270 [Clostridiaceae bacterium]
MRKIVRFSTTCYFDFTGYYLYREGKEAVRVHGYRYKLLERFTENPRVAFSRDELERCNPKYDPAVITGGRSVDTQISILRSYDGAIYNQIVPVRGTGYQYIGARPINSADEETPKEYVKEGEAQKTIIGNNAGKRDELTMPESVDDKQRLCDSKRARLLWLLGNAAQARTGEQIQKAIMGLQAFRAGLSEDRLDVLRVIVNVTEEIYDGLQQGSLEVAASIASYISEFYLRLLLMKIDAEITQTRCDLERARIADDAKLVNQLQLRLAHWESLQSEFEPSLNRSISNDGMTI